jgi:hypothetical protein
VIKVIIVVIMLLGFAWAFPPTRARMSLVVEPAVERIAPQAERLLNPMRKSGARREITFILREIAAQRLIGRPLPDPREFRFWVREKVEAVEDGLDPWGTPYYMRRSRGTVTVGSAGVDRTPGTGDDVRVTVPYDE